MTPNNLTLSSVVARSDIPGSSSAMASVQMHFSSLHTAGGGGSLFKLIRCSADCCKQQNKSGVMKKSNKYDACLDINFVSIGKL